MTSPDELQVADLIARNLLRSPTTFRGNTFVKLRVSGTGIAFRPKVNEWTLRSPEIWLSPRMVRRCAGVPVIIQHPDRQLLDGDELRQRVVGVCLLGYVQNAELWAVARIVNDEAATVMASAELDTSPACAFTGKPKFVPIGKSKLLIEDDVALLDHLAVVSRGVWTRAGEPGIEVGEQHATQ